MKPRTILCVTVLMGPTLLGLGCGSHGPRPRKASERLPRLEVVKVTRGAVERRLDLAATVEAYQRVDLSARVPGVVEHLPATVDIGKKITQGEVLMRLAVPDLVANKKHKEAVLEQSKKQEEQARAALGVAQREVEETKKEDKRHQAEVAYQRLRLERIRDLVRRKAQDLAVQQEVERQLASAEAALDANRAKVGTKQARVGAATADLDVAARRIMVATADVQKVAEMVEFATVRAPFDGVITRRWVDQGAIIKDPGATLLTVMQIDRVRVLVDVPQRDVPLINDDERKPNANGKGDPVTVRIPALAEVVKNGDFEGTITRTGQSLDPVTRTMRAEVVLDNKEGYLRSGMFGTASILLEKRSDRLTVPASALVPESENKVVVYYVAPTGDGASPSGASEEQRGVLKRVEVRRGIDDGKRVEVHAGLKGGELVVVRADSALRVDDAVIAIPAE